MILWHVILLNQFYDISYKMTAWFWYLAVSNIAKNNRRQGASGKKFLILCITLDKGTFHSKADIHRIKPYPDQTSIRFKKTEYVLPAFSQFGVNFDSMLFEGMFCKISSDQNNAERSLCNRILNLSGALIFWYG